MVFHFYNVPFEVSLTLSPRCLIGFLGPKYLAYCILASYSLSLAEWRSWPIPFSSTILRSLVPTFLCVFFSDKPSFTQLFYLSYLLHTSVFLCFFFSPHIFIGLSSIWPPLGPPYTTPCICHAGWPVLAEDGILDVDVPHRLWPIIPSRLFGLDFF